MSDKRVLLATNPVAWVLAGLAVGLVLFASNYFIVAALWRAIFGTEPARPLPPPPANYAATAPHRPAVVEFSKDELLAMAKARGMRPNKNWRRETLLAKLGVEDAAG